MKKLLLTIPIIGVILSLRELFYVSERDATFGEIILYFIILPSWHGTLFSLSIYFIVNYYV